MNGIVMVTTKSYDKILWLRVVEPKGAGFMLRADLGFENGDIAAVHCFLKGGGFVSQVWGIECKPTHRKLVVEL